MEITIRGEPKEITALVVGLQGQQSNMAVDKTKLVKELIHLQESLRECGKPTSGQNLQIPEQPT